MRSLRCQQAVSSVVGTVLLLAITVSTFGGVAFVVMQEVESNGSPPRVDLHIESVEGRFVVKHRGGDSLPAAGVTIRVYDGVDRHDLLASAFPIGPTWDIGESLHIGDVFPGVPTGVVVIARTGDRSDLLVASGSAQAAAGGPPADLSITALHSQPLIAQQPVSFRARLHNDGGAAAGSTVLFEVLDGTSVVFSSSRTTSALAGGATRSITSAAWTPTTGTFTLRVTADAADTVAEQDESDNRWVSGSFSPAPAGAVGVGFVDLDGDAAFTPGSDLQIQAHSLTAQECAATSCSAGDLGHVATSGGLYLLPGTLQTGASIHFEAPGPVVVPMDLEASAAVRIVSGQDITFSGSAATSSNQGAIRIDASGDVTITGATLRTPLVQGQVAVVAGADIQAANAVVASNSITFTAPSDAAIMQDGLAIQDRSGGDGVATNTNLTCVTGTLAQGAWTVEPAPCA